MRRRFVRALGLIATIIVLAACKDSEDKSEKKDVSTSLSDGGAQHDSQATMHDSQASTHDSQASTQDSQASTQDGQASTGDAQAADTQPVVTEKTCAQIEACTSACTDEACSTQCFSQGSATAQSQATAIWTCYDNSKTGACAAQCTDPDSAACGVCGFEACLQVDLTCYSGGSTGTDSCDKVNNCVNNCAMGDPVCSGNCLAKGTAAGQQHLYAWWLCADKRAVNECAATCVKSCDACTNCLADGCLAEQDACEK